MAEVTDKDLASKRKVVDGLREKIAVEVQKASDKRASSDNQIRYARLEVEEERLQAELEAIRESNKLATTLTKEAVASIDEEGLTPSEANPVSVEDDK